MGKCVSFARVVPEAKLLTREMNAAISKGLRSQKLILLRGALREEIAHWLFLENLDDPIPWRDERHIQVSVATDASSSGWGATIIFQITVRFLIIGHGKSTHGTLQQRKPWRSIRCYYRVRMNS